MSRSNPRKTQPITSRDHVLTFGKYKGKTVNDLLENDAQYLAWLHHNNEFFELSNDLLEKAEGWKDEDYEPTLSDIYGKP